MKPASPSWFAALALLCGGAAFGVLAGRWSASPGGESPSLPSAAPESIAGVDDLRRSIDDLARALRERPSALAPRAPSADGAADSRLPALADGPGLERLTSAVERLNELLRASPARSGAAPAPSRSGAGAMIGPGFASLDAMRASIDAIRRAHPDDIDSYASREFSRAHVLWTREDVIDRYGLPLRVEPNGDHQVNLIYEALDLPDQRVYFCFCTRIEPGGLLVDAGVYFGSKDDH